MAASYQNYFVHINQKILLGFIVRLPGKLIHFIAKIAMCAGDT